MATTTKPKIQVQALFDLVVEQCRKVTGFDASSAELALMRKAFDGIFDKAQTRTRKNPLSWCGYTRRDGTIDEAARLQCLQSAFCRLLHYHLGRNSAYLGTIINATENLGSMAQAFGLCPHPASETKWYAFHNTDLPEAVESRRKRAENNAAEKRFADACDTFCQVLVFINSKGKESSVPGAEWRKALGCDQ
jgi:hypothetical protein